MENQEPFKVGELISWKNRNWHQVNVEFFLTHIAKANKFGSGVYKVIKVKNPPQGNKKGDLVLKQKLYLEDSITGESLQDHLPPGSRFWSDFWFERAFE